MATLKNIDYTNKDYDSFRDLMISLIQTKTPEWTDATTSDFGIAIIEALSYCLDLLSYYQDRNANEAFLDTAKLRRSIINLTRPTGYGAEGYSPSEFDEVFVLSEASVEDVIMYKGFQVGTKRTDTEESVVFEVKESYTIPAGSTTATTRVVQGETITEEIIGSSDGTDRQEFTLKYSPVVIDDSLKIYVKENGLWLQWIRVDDFIESESGDRHFTAKTDEDDVVTIAFSNGVVGKIPVQGNNNIKADYRICNGVSGNVGVDTIVQIISDGVPLLKSVNNPTEAVVLGTDKESIDSIRFYAPKQYRVLQRAVTDLDFKDLVLLYKDSSGNRIVKACDIQKGIPYVIYVILYSGIPDATTLSDISNYLEPLRLLLDSVSVVAGTEVAVDTTISVTAYSNYQNATIQSQIEGAVADYFNALDMKQTVYLNDLVAKVKSIEGVSNFNITSPLADVTLSTGEIAKQGITTVTVTGGV